MFPFSSYSKNNKESSLQGVCATNLTLKNMCVHLWPPDPVWGFIQITCCGVAAAGSGCIWTRVED